MQRLLTPHAASRRLRADRRGATGLVFALSLTMFMAFVGAAVDYTRTTDARVALQNAVDEAALAGAAAYTDPAQASAAAVVAKTYFNTAVQGFSQVSSTTGPAVAVVPKTMSNGQSSYQVTVSTTAVLMTTFMMIWTPSTSVAVTATAANPIVTPTFSIGDFQSQASDANTAYAYPVPMSGGKPQYGQIPPQSQFYNINSNNPNFAPPANQAFPSVSATQPIGFALANITGGNKGYRSNFPWWNCNNPGSNQYGSITGPGNFSGVSGTGHTNWFYSSFLALGQSPATDTNYSYSYTGYINANGSCSQQQTIHTSTSYPANTNCSFQAGVYTSTTSYLNAPGGANCFSPTNTPGLQYATMSCQQMGGTTYAIWWNDMGGYSDDHDYNDAWFTFSCSTNTPTGQPAITQVVLIQ